MAGVYIALLETDLAGTREPFDDPGYWRQWSSNLTWRHEPFGVELREELIFEFEKDHRITHAAIFLGPRGGRPMWTVKDGTCADVRAGDAIVIPPGKLSFKWDRIQREGIEGEY